MKIIVYGERNSGTGFLEFLLRKNVVDEKNIIYVSPKVDKKSYAWKHGVPTEFDTNIFFKNI